MKEIPNTPDTSVVSITDGKAIRDQKNSIAETAPKTMDNMTVFGENHPRAEIIAEKTDEIVREALKALSFSRPATEWLFDYDGAMVAAKLQAAVQEACKRLIEITNEQKEFVTTASQNQKLLMKLNYITDSLFQYRNIFSAVTALKKNYETLFPGRSILLILTPNYDQDKEGGAKVKDNDEVKLQPNPLADKLVDLLELCSGGRLRQGEVNKEEQKKILELAEFLPVMEWAISGVEYLPQGIKVIDGKQLKKIMQGAPYRLIVSEEEQLNRDIFGDNIGSALIHELATDDTSGTRNRFAYFVITAKNGSKQFTAIDSVDFVKSALTTQANILSIIGAYAENILDGLTKIPLRRNFEQSALRMIEAVRNMPKEVTSTKENAATQVSEAPVISVALVDIDDFKYVNDNFGHPMGDLVIQTVAQVINTRSSEINSRPSEIKGRWGWEEFIVMFQGSAEKIKIALERAKETLSKLWFEFSPDGKHKVLREAGPAENRFQVTFSAGVAEAKNFDSSKKNRDIFNSLVSLSDARLLIVKKSWKKRIECYATVTEASTFTPRQKILN